MSSAVGVPNARSTGSERGNRRRSGAVGIVSPGRWVKSPSTVIKCSDGELSAWVIWMSVKFYLLDILYYKISRFFNPLILFFFMASSVLRMFHGMNAFGFSFFLCFA